MIWKKESKILKINLNDQFKLYIKTMLPYSLKCRKNTESKNPNVATTKNRRIMLL